MVDSVKSFFGAMFKAASGVFQKAVEPVVDGISAVTDGINATISYLKDAFDLLNSLVSIFPTPLKVMFLSFISIAGVYLLYKIVRSG